MYLGGSLRIAPNYLAYFNVPGGYRYLVDSNLDWGQNLWQLRDWMRENNVERVYYAHYSPARPQVYGVEANFLPPDPRAVPFAPFDPAAGVYAIGATVLQGAYTPDVNTYAWFRTHEPVARLGHALFVYQVPPRPQPAWAAVCADPAPVLSPETVRANLGRVGKTPDGAEQLAVVVANDSGGGQLAGFVTIRTSDTLKPEIRIPVTASLPGDVALEPDVIAFGPTLPGKAVAQTVRVFSPSGVAFKVMNVSSSIEHLAFDVAPAAQGGYEIVIKVKDGAPAGRVTGEITVATDRQGEPALVARVTGHVRSAR